MSAKADPSLDEDLVIDLPRPIELPGGDMLTQIVIPEPTAEQMLQWDKLSGVEADMTAISVVAGIPKAVVGKLPARAFNRAAKRIGDFLA